MIEGVKRVFLDSPLIYFVEREGRYWSAVSLVFDRIDAGLMMAVTSPVTLAECLVLPYCKNHHDLVQEFVDRVVSSNMLPRPRSARSVPVRAWKRLTAPLQAFVLFLSAPFNLSADYTFSLRYSIPSATI